MAYSDQILLTEGVSAATATNTVDIGTRRLVNGREYIYMYNGGAEAAPNKVVVVTGTSGYTFVVTYASGAAISATPIGVVREATIAASSYGWVMTRGFCDVYNDGTASVTTGDVLVLSTNGNVRQYSAASVVTQLVYNGIVAKAMQSTDTAGTVGAYVRLG